MKTLFLIALLSIATHSYSQVYKFKALEYCIDPNKGKYPISDKEWNQVDYLVVLNIDKSKIDIYSSTESHLDILKTFDPEKDDDNNDFIYYTAVDNEGDKVDVKLTIFRNSKSEHVATLRIKYSFGDVVIRLKKNL